MTRDRAFYFLTQLEALRVTSELTGPVTISLEGLVSNDLLGREPLSSINGSLHCPLDWWVHVGGDLRAQYERKFLVEARLAKRLHLEFAMRPDPVVVFEIVTWLETRLAPLLALMRAEGRPLEISVGTLDQFENEWTEALPGLQPASWNSIGVQFENIVEESLKLVGLQALIEAKLADEFVRTMNSDLGLDVFEPPWIFWSRLPGWLKYRGAAVDLHKIELRLSFLRSGLSPQDEIGELESLTSNEVMLNPTFETVELSRSVSPESPLIARARLGSSLTSRTITGLEALVLDQVRESFRSPRANIVRNVAAESGIQKEFVDRAIDQLRRDSFLLCGK